MPRWRQTINPETGKSEFIEIGAVKRPSGGVAIHGDITSFVSPVDGSVITDRKQLAEHNKRNNVVNADEFSPEFYAKKAKERADFYQGEHSKAESLKRKQEIYETWTRAERDG